MRALLFLDAMILEFAVFLQKSMVELQCMSIVLFNELKKANYGQFEILERSFKSDLSIQTRISLVTKAFEIFYQVTILCKGLELAQRRGFEV